MTTISDKDRADAQAMADKLAHMREARDNARAEVERPGYGTKVPISWHAVGCGRRPRVGGADLR